jgi:hypothetical protein
MALAAYQGKHEGSRTGLIPVEQIDADAAQMDAGSAQVRQRSRRGAKTRLRSLADLDGRTAAYRRTCELISAVEADLGGADQLSTGERQIIQRAALTGALAEDLEARWLDGEDIDPALYATLGNAQRRLLEALGLQRRARLVQPLGTLMKDVRNGA